MARKAHRERKKAARLGKEVDPKFRKIRERNIRQRPEQKPEQEKAEHANPESLDPQATLKDPKDSPGLHGPVFGMPEGHVGKLRQSQRRNKQLEIRPPSKSQNPSLREFLERSHSTDDSLPPGKKLAEAGHLSPPFADAPKTSADAHAWLQNHELQNLPIQNPDAFFPPQKEPFQIRGQQQTSRTHAAQGLRVQEHPPASMPQSNMPHSSLAHLLQALQAVEPAFQHPPPQQVSGPGSAGAAKLVSEPRPSMDLSTDHPRPGGIGGSAGPVKVSGPSLIAMQPGTKGLNPLHGRLDSQKQDASGEREPPRRRKPTNPRKISNEEAAIQGTPRDAR